MKEITVITTCEITTIVRDDNPDALLENKEEFDNRIRQLLQAATGADNVNLLKNQIFVRDMDEAGE